MLLLKRSVNVKQRLKKSSAILLHTIFRRKLNSSNDKNDVIFEEVNGKGIISLNRPRVRNALSTSMAEIISIQMMSWQAELRPVIFKAIKGVAFSAGGDLKETLSRKADLSTNLTRMIALIASFQPPCTVLMDGLTLGAGCSISVNGLFSVATERTVFALPEVAVGYFPDLSASYFLPRLPSRLGYLLALTGHQLEGRQVLEAGLATHYCQSACLPDLQEALVSCPGTSSLDMEHILEEHAQSGGSCTDSTMALNLKDVEACFSAATVEDIMLRLKCLDHTWAREALARMAAGSPIALKVTKKLLDNGAKMTLRECLLMAHSLSLNYTLTQVSDIDEGVRATLINKDRRPCWKPAKLEGVTDDIVDKLFAPLSSRFDLQI